MEGDADRAAFRRLFDEAYRPLLAYALRRGETPGDAEEIVAETLLVAWRRRAELSSSSRPGDAAHTSPVDACSPS